MKLYKLTAILSRLFFLLTCWLTATGSWAQSTAPCGELVTLDAPVPAATANMGAATSVSARFAMAASNTLGQAPGAAHIYEYTGGEWVFRQTLSPSEGLPRDIFGGSLYIDDSTALVGAYGYRRPGDPSAATGAVYVFTRVGATWTQTGLITNPSRVLGSFGWTLDKSGRTVVVGYNPGLSNGEVHLFQQPLQPTQPWPRVATLQAPSRSANYQFGYSVAIHGQELVVGAIGLQGQPSASFYHQVSPGNWQHLQTELYPVGQLTATKVAVHGRFAAIGSDSNLGVRLYERGATGWQLRQTLFSPDGSRGRYGLTVAMNARVLLVSNGQGPTDGSAGVVYRYELAGDRWLLQRRYTPPQPRPLDTFGASAAVDDESDNLIIGGVWRVSGGLARAGQAFVLGQPRVLPAGPYCLSDPPVALQATAPGGSWTGPGVTNPISGQFSPAVAGPGTHQISYSLLTGDCPFQDTLQITVREEVRIIRGAAPKLSCLRDTLVQLQATLTGGTWQGAGLLSGNSGQFSPALAGPGRHTLTYRLAGAALCRAQDTLSLVVAPAVVRILSAPPTLCRLDTVVALAATPVGGQWEGRGLNPTTPGRFSAATAGPGRHVVRYRVGTGRCVVMDSITVLVSPLPVPVLQAASPLLLTCGVTSAELRLSLGLPAGTTVAWQTAATADGPWQTVSAGATSPTYLAQQAGWYRVQTGAGACRSASLPLQVAVAPAAAAQQIPDIFTPNGDGKNDVFDLHLPAVRAFRLQVFNRWGQPVFSSARYGDFWTGRNAPAGVYYYLLHYTTDCNGLEETVKGQVTVNR